MTKSINNLVILVKGFIRFSFIFFLLIFLSPVLGIHMHALLGRVVSNFLFFWPQMALLPSGIINNEIGSSESYGAEGQSTILAIIFWILAGVFFSWGARHLDARRKIILVYPYIVIVTIGIVFLMNLMGYSPYLEGP